MPVEMPVPAKSVQVGRFTIFPEKIDGKKDKQSDSDIGGHERGVSD